MYSAEHIVGIKRSHVDEGKETSLLMLIAASTKNCLHDEYFFFLMIPLFQNRRVSAGRPLVPVLSGILRGAYA